MATETDTKVHAELRENFGKGFARRLRAAGKIPAVIYGHGTDPVHVALPGHQVALIVRRANAVLELDINGKQQLTLVKDVQKDPVHQIIEHIDLRSVRQIGFGNAEDIAKKVLARFDAGEFDVCSLFYSQFKSVIAQIPTAQQIIPLVVEDQNNGNGAATSYEYEPEEDEILTRLLPRNVAVQIFRALLENNASFYGAQMSAMDNATRNAGEMIRKQTLVYNRTRQAQITKELIEIISGAAAV